MKMSRRCLILFAILVFGSALLADGANIFSMKRFQNAAQLQAQAGIACVTEKGCKYKDTKGDTKYMRFNAGQCHDSTKKDFEYNKDGREWDVVSESSWCCCKSGKGEVAICKCREKLKAYKIVLKQDQEEKLDAQTITHAALKRYGSASSTNADATIKDMKATMQPFTDRFSKCSNLQKIIDYFEAKNFFLTVSPKIQIGFDTKVLDGQDKANEAATEYLNYGIMITLVDDCIAKVGTHEVFCKTTEMTRGAGKMAYFHSKASNKKFAWLVLPYDIMRKLDSTLPSLADLKLLKNEDRKAHLDRVEERLRECFSGYLQDENDKVIKPTELDVLKAKAVDTCQ